MIIFQYICVKIAFFWCGIKIYCGNKIGCDSWEDGPVIIIHPTDLFEGIYSSGIGSDFRFDVGPINENPIGGIVIETIGPSLTNLRLNGAASGVN